MIIYLDESGDLGWSFNAPYRSGGSSRYLTISSLVVARDKKHLPKRLVRKMYKKFNWNISIEKKWYDMKHHEQLWFAEQANNLAVENPNCISYLSITVKKEKVADHIRSDANKLYNYMIGLSLLDEMSVHEEVVFIPDPRSIKVESGNSLHDYIQTKLWFEKNVKTQLTTTPLDSSSCVNLQFADMLSGIVQKNFEDQKSDAWNKIKSNFSYKTLYFK